MYVALENFGQHNLSYNFVEGLLRPNKVLSQKLLDAFLLVPRENFLPAVQRQAAYLDSHTWLPDGRCLISPFILGQLLNVAELKPDDKVLVVGAATGYSMALIKEIVGDVYGVECSCELRDEAEQNVAEFLGADLPIHLGPLPHGYDDKAPYDVILVEGAVAEPPKELIRQLSLDGRLVAIFNSGLGMGKGVVWQKTDSGVSQTTYFDAQAPYLPGFEPVPTFKL